MSVEIGNKVEGKVTGIAKFGAFVELPGGVIGLLHISEIAHNFVKDVNDHLKVGDSVSVEVIGQKDSKFALSIKKTIEAPEKKSFSPKPFRSDRKEYSSKNRQSNTPKPVENFEDKISRFLKNSEENLSVLKRNTETKRGGRGGRRS